MVAFGAVLGGLKKAGSAIGGFLTNNASSLASSLGSLGSSFISAATSKGAQARAYNYARQLQQHQYDLTQQGYRETPTNQRIGFEDAGYNPMLALGNVGSSASIAGGTPVTANATDTSGVRDAISQAVTLKNQTKGADSSSDAYYAQADKTKVEKAILLQRLPYVSKQEKAQYMKTSMEAAKLENDIHYQNEYLNYLDKSLEVQQRLGEMGFANAKDVATITSNATKYGVDKPIEITKDKEKRYKEWGNKHPYLRNVDETISRYFNGFGYNASSVYKGR